MNKSKRYRKKLQIMATADDSIRRMGNGASVAFEYIAQGDVVAVLSDECEPVSAGIVTLSLIPHKGRAIRSEGRFCSA